MFQAGSPPRNEHTEPWHGETFDSTLNPQLLSLCPGGVQSWSISSCQAALSNALQDRTKPLLLCFLLLLITIGAPEDLWARP